MVIYEQRMHENIPRQDSHNHEKLVIFSDSRADWEFLLQLPDQEVEGVTLNADQGC